MLLAMTVLLIQPQLVSPISFSPEQVTAVISVASIASPAVAGVEDSSLTATASLVSEAQPAGEADSALPDAPVPVEPISAPAPAAFLNPGKPMTVSVAQLREENRRKQMLWRGLSIATSSAATFDAWTTRRAISTQGAVELDPLLKPFAGNSSLYAAIQVAPALLDFAGKKMMYSRHSWIRRVWWVPQSASFVSSIFCGAHNLAYH